MNHKIRRHTPRLIGAGLTTAVFLVAGMLLAKSDGVSGVSQSPTGCSCHGTIPNMLGDVTVDITGPTTVEPNQTNSYTIFVTGGPLGTTGGFDLSADGGTLIPGVNNKLDAGDLVHVDENSRSWTFDWQAPVTQGTVNLFAVGLSSDGRNTNGDSWNWYGNAQGTPFAINVQQSVGVGDAPFGATALAAPYPNPFMSSTRIEFTLPIAGPAKISVYNVAGRKVAILASGNYQAGRQVVNWNGRDTNGSVVTSGLYFIRLEAAGNVLTKRVIKI